MIKLKDGLSIMDYGRINVILGNNGTGKSRLLRKMDSELSGRAACIRYITPERGAN